MNENPSTEVERGKGEPKSRSGTFGSRFASLNDETEVDEMETEGVNVDGIQGRSEETNAKGNKIPTSKGDVNGSRFAYQVIDEDCDEMDMERSHVV